MFTGLNVRGFNPIEVFMKMLACCLGQKCLLYSRIEERGIYSWKKFCNTLENRENHESLAQ